MSSFRLIYITSPNKAEAKRIAESLVEEKLAACANFFTVESIYRWKGKLRNEKEVVLIVKTKAKLVEKIIKRVKELHSYEVPCIISLLIEKGYQKYLRWIDQSINK